MREFAHKGIKPIRVFSVIFIGLLFLASSWYILLSIFPFSWHGSYMKKNGKTFTKEKREKQINHRKYLMKCLMRLFQYSFIILSGYILMFLGLVLISSQAFTFTDIFHFSNFLRAIESIGSRWSYLYLTSFMVLYPLLLWHVVYFATDETKDGKVSWVSGAIGNIVNPNDVKRIMNALYLLILIIYSISQLYGDYSPRMSVIYISFLTYLGVEKVFPIFDKLESMIERHKKNNVDDVSFYQEMKKIELHQYDDYVDTGVWSNSRLSKFLKYGK